MPRAGGVMRRKLRDKFDGGRPAPVPTVVSFKAKWSGVDSRVNLKNPANGFAGEYVRGQAQTEWTAYGG
jgi:hypothetical protein